MLRLNGLSHFLAVCSTRSLTEAAQLMGVSQPALTQAIAKLERQLDATLFDRSTRPVGLTPYGKVLQDYARSLERDADELVATLDAMKDGSGGVLRVGCGPDWIHEILPIAIAQLQAEHSNIRVVLTVALNDELRSMLDAGTVDIFFSSISDAYFGAAYETQVLLREAMLVVANKDHPALTNGSKSLKELAGFPWVMTGDETFGRQLLRRMFGRAGLQMPAPTVETNSVRAMINLLRYSQTLGFLSQTHELAFSEIAAVDLTDVLPLREGGVTWRRDTPPMPVAEKLISLAKAVIAGRAKQEEP